MRILVSNPDTIGDVVLRQPMFRALAQAGHDLMLVVRPALAPIMGLVAPEARVAVCGPNPYESRLAFDAPALKEVARAAAEFDPDVLVVAPYQWTVLEERLQASLPRARCIAMSGRRYVDPRSGLVVPSRLSPAVVVEVAQDLPELAKNQRLASAVLGRNVELDAPSLEPNGDNRRMAEAEAARLGLAAGGFWIACVGDEPYSAVRNWRPDQWGELLSRWAGTHRASFLFVGLEAEAATMDAVRGAMGDAVGAVAEWRGREGGDLEMLIGLIALSRGYVGRDTGPMHIAAALGKPVLAVFGGGTWPRFVPAGPASVAITVGVPCIGCEWRCHLPESYCIKRVPVEEVWKAVEGLERGEAVGPEARVLAPGAELLTRIGREGAESARARLVQVSVARRELAEERMGMNRDGDIAMDDPAVVLHGVEPKPGAFRESRREESVARVAQLQARLTEQARLRGEQQGAIESLREQLGEARARSKDLEARLEKRTAELLTATAEGAAARERLRNSEAQAQARQAESDRALASARREAEQLRQKLDAATEAGKIAQAEAQQARAEAKQWKEQARISAAEAVRSGEHAGAALKAELKGEVEALKGRLTEAKQQAAGRAAERERLAAELAKVREERAAVGRELEAARAAAERLGAAQRALGAAQADVHDLKARAQRLESDRAALASLSRQHEQRIAVLQARLDDLMRSRARRWGQRLGVVQTMDWEIELQHARADGNGRA